MIKVDCPPLSDNARRTLARRRANASRWTIRNPQRNRMDEEVTATLRDSFQGKCGYCEGVEAETIDHFWPQAGYADRIWVWENYIWACDACQRRKRSQPPHDITGHLMVNPREDEPLFFLRFEAETGKVVAVPVGGATEARGAYTIRLLQLDRRPDLDEERRLKQMQVVDLLVQLVDPASSPAQADRAWQRLQAELMPRRPYLAIIQQLFTLPSPDLQPLVEQLYRVRPESEALFRAFHRPVPLVPPANL